MNHHSSQHTVNRINAPPVCSMCATRLPPRPIIPTRMCSSWSTFFQRASTMRLCRCFHIHNTNRGAAQLTSPGPGTGHGRKPALPPVGSLHSAPLLPSPAAPTRHESIGCSMRFHPSTSRNPGQSADKLTPREAATRVRFARSWSNSTQPRRSLLPPPKRSLRRCCLQTAFSGNPWAPADR